jgi:hypothetical protein
MSDANAIDSNNPLASIPVRKTNLGKKYKKKKKSLNFTKQSKEHRPELKNPTVKS